MRIAVGEYRLSPEARDDLIELWGYVRSQSGSERRADASLRAVLDTIERITVFPGMGTERDRFGPGVLAFATGSWLVLYRERPGGIEVVRVTGAHRDIV